MSKTLKTLNDKTIILISGKMRSGKDTIAEILKERLSSDKTKPCVLHFSDPMKFIISKTLDIPYISIDKLKNYNDDITLTGKTSDYSTFTSFTSMRRILQKFGTDAMQEVFGKDVWTRLMLEKIERDDKHNIFIIPDFRFKHEYIQDAVTIRIVPDVSEHDETSTEKHISEHDLDNFKFDYTIKNPKTVVGVADSVYADCANIVNDVLKTF